MNIAILKINPDLFPARFSWGKDKTGLGYTP